MHFCVCVRVRVRPEWGGWSPLTYHYTTQKPHRYFEKEINIAISGSSCVCASTQGTCLRTSEKTEWRISTSDEEFPAPGLERWRDAAAAWRHSSHHRARCSLSTLQVAFPFKAGTEGKSGVKATPALVWEKKLDLFLPDCRKKTWMEVLQLTSFTFNYHPTMTDVSRKNWNSLYSMRDRL